jgi:hypothetical protein
MEHKILTSVFVFVYFTGSAQFWQGDDKLSAPQTYSEVTSRFGEKYQSGDIHYERRLKHFMRWQHAMEPHIGPDGNLFNYAAYNYSLSQKDPLINAPSSTRNTFGHWIDTNPDHYNTPAPGSGRVNTIAVHPVDSNTLFAGAAVGGLWKSTNGGNSWICLTDGLPVIGITSIVIHPDLPNTIYILTGDAFGKYIPSIGVLKSTDGGYTWHPTNFSYSPDQLQYGYKLVMDPNNPNIMFAATTNGLIRTNDGWNTITPMLSSVTFIDIEFKPGNSNIIYASSTSSIYRTSTGGVVGFGWINQGPLGIGLPSSVFTRVTLAVTPDAPNSIYALYAHDDSTNAYQGLYISIDNGTSWSGNFDDINILGVGTSSQVWYDLALAVSPNNAEIVFAGGVKLYKSESMGEEDSWDLNHTNLHDDIHDIIFGSPTTIYVACDGGIAKSVNGGATWSSISNGLKIMQVYDCDIRGNARLAGSQDNGTNVWGIGDPEGEKYVGGDGFEVIFHPTDINIIYACTQSQRYKSSNGGNDFESIQPPGHGSPWDASWIMHPTDYDTLYCAFDNIARSYNAGASWDTMAAPPLTSRGAIRAMAQGINNPNVMYVSNRKQIFRTDNIHAAIPVWVDLTPFIPGVTPADTFPNSQQIGGIAVDDTDANKVWITFRNYVADNKVFYHANGGADTNWINLTNSLPNVPVYTIVNQPGSGNAIYVATDLGVFFTYNSLDDWLYWSNGLPNTRVEDLRIHNGYLYAATFGRGIWRSETYAACPFTLVLTQANDPSNPHSTGTQINTALNTIQSSRIITGGYGTDVRYTAGTDIILIPGFHARSFSAFLANLGACYQ